MPPKPLPSGIPPKSWTWRELQERWDGFWYIRDQRDPKWDTDSRINIAFVKFLDWLSAEEEDVKS
ncbi:hypothetical protein LCGC14_2340470 [marine sediment metagenome]|uniref:Uncharacterized protein n=1 Tax=marine sediment metagenome TaxID=412755 RepID=A0A0F9F795_9ZZZZ